MNNNQLRVTKAKACKSHYEFIFENIQDVFYETTIDGTILEMSPSVEYVLNYRREELIGKSVYILYAEPAQRDELIKAVQKEKYLCDYEVLLKRKDGVTVSFV